MHRIIFWERTSWPDRLEASLHKVRNKRLYVAQLHLQQIGIHLPPWGKLYLSDDANAGLITLYENGVLLPNDAYFVVRVHTTRKESQYHGWTSGAIANKAAVITWPPGTQRLRKVVFDYELFRGVPSDRSEVEAAASVRWERVPGVGDVEASRERRRSDACEVRQRRLFDP